jgi:hypothetical protein
MLLDDGKVNAVEQPMQLPHAQCYGLASRWLDEPASLKPFHQQTHAVATPPQYLHQIAASAAEFEHAAERIALLRSGP